MPASRATSKAIIMAMPSTAPTDCSMNRSSVASTSRRHLHRARAQDAERRRPAPACAAARGRSRRPPRPRTPRSRGPRDTRARGGAGHARGHQQHVDAGGRVDEVEGEAVARAERDRAARPERGRDRRVEDGGDHLVGQQHVHHVVGGRGRDRHDLEALAPRLLGVLVVAIADADLGAGVAQVERGGAAEVAVAEHRHRLAGERARAAHPPRDTLGPVPVPDSSLRDTNLSRVGLLRVRALGARAL